MTWFSPKWLLKLQLLKLASWTPLVWCSIWEAQVLCCLKVRLKCLVAVVQHHIIL